MRAASSRRIIPLVVAALVALWAAGPASALPVGLVKSVTDVNGGVVEPGDILEYRIVARNPPPLPAAGVVVTDPIPAGTTYVAGSLVLDGVARTDAIDADGAQIVLGTPTFILGTMPASTTATRVVTFRVRANPTLADGSVISNRATATYVPGVALSNVLNTTVTILPPVLTANVTATDLNGGDVQPGDILRHTLTTVNVGTGPAANVVATSGLPPRTTLVPGTLTIDGVSRTDATGDDSGEIGPGGGTFRLGTGADATTGGQIAPGGGTATVTFDVRVDDDVMDGTSITHGATVRYTRVVGGPVLVATAPTSTTVVSAPPGLTLEKTVVDVNGGDVEPGDVLAYNVTASSTGVGFARDVIARDAVPAGTAYVPGSLGVNGVPVSDASADDVAEITGGEVVARLGVGADSSQGGVMPPGTTATFSFQVVVNADLADGTVFANQAHAQFHGFADGLPRTASSGVVGTTVTNVPRTPNVVITERFVLVYDADGDGLIGPGDFVQYTITIANTGRGSATNVTFDQLIPSVGTFINRSLFITRGTARFRAPRTITVSIPTLAPQETVSAAYVVRLKPTVTSTAQLVTRSSVTAGVVNPGPAVPSQPVARPPRLRMTIRGPRRIRAGELATYHVHIANLSRRNVTSLTLQQVIPRGLAVAGSAPRLTFSRSHPRWRIGVIRAGSSVTLVVRFRAARTARGLRTNQVRLTGTTITPLTLRAPLTILPARRAPVPRVVG